MAPQTPSAENFLEKIDTKETDKNVINDQEILDFLKDTNNHQDIKDQFAGSVDDFVEALQQYTIEETIEETGGKKDKAKDDVEEFLASEKWRALFWTDEAAVKAMIRFDLFLEKAEKIEEKSIVTVESVTDANIHERFEQLKNASIKPYENPTGDITKIKKEWDIIAIRDNTKKETKLSFKDGKFTYNDKGGIQGVDDTVSMPSIGGYPIIVVGQKAYKMSFAMGEFTCEEIKTPGVNDQKIDEVQRKVSIALKMPNLKFEKISLEGKGESNKLYKVTTNDLAVSFSLDANLSPEGEKVGDKEISFVWLEEKIYKDALEKELDPKTHMFIKTQSGTIFSLPVKNEAEKNTITSYLKDLEDRFGDQNNENLLHGSGIEGVAIYLDAMEEFVAKYKGKTVTEVFTSANQTAGGMYIDSKGALSPDESNAEKEAQLLGVYESISGTQVTKIEATQGYQLVNTVGNAAISILWVWLLSRRLHVDTSSIDENETKDKFYEKTTKVYSAKEI